MTGRNQFSRELRERRRESVSHCCVVRDWSAGGCRIGRCNWGGVREVAGVIVLPREAGNDGKTHLSSGLVSYVVELGLVY